MKQVNVWKKMRKMIGYTLLAYLIYLIIGMTVPFIKSVNVSKEHKESFSKDSFYSTDISVDRAAIVETSQDALDIRLHMLNEAKEKIVVSTFSIKNDKSSKEFVSILYAAALRGVKVQLLVDGLSGWYDMKNDPMYYALGTLDNVEIRYYNPFDALFPWTFHGRLHDKYIIIDDSLLLLGGRNISDYFLGEYNPEVLSYDRDIFVYNTTNHATTDSVISDVHSYFQETWTSNECKIVFDHIPSTWTKKVQNATLELQSIYDSLVTQRKELFAPVDYQAVTTATNKISLIHNPTHIMSKEPWIWYDITQLMLSAKDDVTVQTPYAVFNKEMYQTFTNVYQTVPHFKMLLNSRAGGDNFVASSDYTIHKKNLLKTNVSLYEFQGAHSMHNKSVAIDDDISIIGSYNFDMRSTYLDTEVMLVVHSKDFNTKLRSCMKDMQNQSLLVNKDGTYVSDSNVEPLSLSTTQKILFPVTSVIFQLIRYLL